MRKAIVLSVVAVMAIAIAASPASAVFMFYGEKNTFSGIARGDDAGYFGAPPGTQGADFGFLGSYVSVDDKGTPGIGDDVLNVPQAALIPAHGPVPLPPPGGAIFETDTVTDTLSHSFGQELTAIMGGLWPAAVFVTEGVGLYTGLSPGSIPLPDPNVDQIIPAASGVAGFRTYFGPGTPAALLPGPGFFPYPSAPVFEIYDDTPTVNDLDLGSASSTLDETEMDFDGAVDPAPRFPATPHAGLIGPTEPPPWAAPPSQFDAIGGLNLVAATNGGMWASGWIDNATASYEVFHSGVAGYDPTDPNSPAPNGGYVYRVTFYAQGVVTAGSVLPILAPIVKAGAYDGSDINITFTATLFGEAFSNLYPGPGGAPLGVDPLSSWDLTHNLAGNSGPAAFSIVPIPEPATLALLGFALVPLAFRKRKRSA